MRISSKARYGLASMICLAQTYKSNIYIAVQSISEKLDISKIYLEQVFSLLKRANLVISTKGAQGGYQLADKPDRIYVYDVLKAIETSLFETTKTTVSESENIIEEAMQNLVWNKLDESIEKVLNSVTLLDLVNEAEKHRTADDYMYYI